MYQSLHWQVLCSLSGLHKTRYMVHIAWQSVIQVLTVPARTVTFDTFESPKNWAFDFNFYLSNGFCHICKSS